MQKDIVDYESVEYSFLYSNLKSSASQQDPCVAWIHSRDETRFHSNKQDLEQIGSVIQTATDEWWRSPSIIVPKETKGDEMVFPVPIESNNTLFFMDWVYQYTGMDMNQQTSFLYWQSRATYFSPFYQILYPIVLILLGYIICWFTSPNFQCMSLWSYILTIVTSFWVSITKQGFRNSCFAMIKPAMYFYALYEAFKSRKMHHEAVSSTTNLIQRLVSNWKWQFDTVAQFSSKLHRFLLQEENRLTDGHVSTYMHRQVAEKFAMVKPFFEKFFHEYQYLLDPKATFDDLYASLGKTLVLRWQLTFTKEHLKYKTCCQVPLTILSEIASQVALVRMWNVLKYSVPSMSKRVNVIQWIEEDGGEETMTDSYYPFLLLPERNDKSTTTAVGNSCLFGETNAVITGPNATGKTTYLKSVMLNLLFAHHVGVGFFSSCTIAKPFHHFFCYINVPDTSERESLFQAEATRALSILKEAEESTKSGERTFAIFDELFTGTNPEDAAKLTKALLRHLAKNQNLRFLTTTHFTSAIENMREEDFPQEKDAIKEQTEEEEQEVDKGVPIRYLQTDYDSLTGKKTYLLKEGVSRESNVLKVLTDLQFPSSILRCL